MTHLRSTQQHSTAPRTSHKKILMSLITLAAGVSALSACGISPLSSVGIQDQRVPVPINLSASSVTAYSQIPGGLPSGVPISSIGLSGRSKVEAAPGSPMTSDAAADVYASAGRPTNCTEIDQTLLCSAPQGQKIGALKLGQTSQPFSLNGQKLGQGLKNGNLWIGLQITSGSIPAGSSVVLEKLEAHGKI